jgi:hypothetical protein
MEGPEETRRKVLKLAALGAAVGVLAALTLALRQTKQPESPPLEPHDSMRAWSEATPARKRETAEKVLDVLYAEQVFGPQTRLAYSDPQGKQRLINEMIEVLDAGATRNRMTYVSPGQSMVLTAQRAASSKGWNR